MSNIHPAAEGRIPFIYKYAIRLSRNNMIDISSFNALKKNKRVFFVYKWDTTSKPKFGLPNMITVSGWTLWLTFRDRKWEKSNEDNSFGWVGAPLVPMHMFFKTGEEFKEWLGKEAVEGLFAELL